MRTLLLLCLLVAASAMEFPIVPYLPPGQDLPYCRVTVHTATGTKVMDGWYYAPMTMLFPTDPKVWLFNTPLGEDVLKVVPAVRQPGPMPEYIRKPLEDLVTLHNRQVVQADKP